MMLYWLFLDKCGLHIQVTEVRFVPLKENLELGRKLPVFSCALYKNSGILPKDKQGA